MSVTYQGRTLAIDGLALQMQWPVLNAFEQGDKVFVLLDSDSDLLDAEYKRMRRQGDSAMKNLLAFDNRGTKLWEADMPESADYYYRISSVHPLIANSFSSYRCQIDPDTGAIVTKEFLK